MYRSQFGPWPATALDAAQRAFDLLTRPPAPIAFDCRDITGLPPRIMPLDELRRTLINDATPRPARDAVWRELVIRARRDGPAWVVAAVGMALPGLRNSAGRVANGWHGDTSDRDAELLTGFVERIAVVDIDQPRICGRLLDAGERAAKRAFDHADQTEILVDHAWSVPPQQPWDHPDLVLARALTAAVITPEESLLIGATRLDDANLGDVARWLGISVELAGAWRNKAEQRLRAAILDGELDHVPLVSRRRRRYRRPARQPAVPARPRSAVSAG